MPAPYFVAVEGQSTPKRAHPSIEIAQREAARLHSARKGRYHVYILETVQRLDALTPVAVVSETGTIRLKRIPREANAQT